MREVDGLRVTLRESVMTIALSRAQRKNPLTFDIYAALRDGFRALADNSQIRAVVLGGEGGNFCSGGDVHEIIGPLVTMSSSERLAFTQMTGDVVLAMRSCPQPIVAAVDGVCAGAGAILAMASDLRLGTQRTRLAFLFVRVGLSGADMGACALLPRIVGLGRASELLFTGRAISGEEAHAWGFFNRLCEPGELADDAGRLAAEIAAGPTRAHAVTKAMLNDAPTMPLDSEIAREAALQAELMGSADFRRAYEAFTAKRTPEFEGN
ncbi:MAG TPA: enoyl-CoA hydratase family protein [Candidatus Dormibacteraeota bacterium]|nr:enoyl-CoA hydratase family protein [Candidatus Dormibacteraeota bacterium]